MNLFISNEQKTPVIKFIINSLLLVFVTVGLFWYSMAKINLVLDFAFLYDMNIRLKNGFLMTIYLSSASLIISLIIGILSAIGYSSRVLFIRYLCRSYVVIIRGTPLIMQIYLFFYIIGTALGINSRFVAGVMILSIFEGAYISEIIRGSILALDPMQLEIAKAVGFTKKQTLKNVILPQLFLQTLPALTGQFASIIKDSSLLSMIAVIELTQTIKEISATNLKLFESYLFLGFLYLCLTLPITFISKALERKFKDETRA